MTNEEFIKFEITDLDLENEFAPFRAKKLTKNQQIYGIWADDEEDDSDDNRSTKYSSKSKNYTAPVNFVAGGIHQPGKKIKETTDEKEKNEISKDDVISDSSEEEVACTSFSKKSSIIQSDMAGFRRKDFREYKDNIFMQKGVGNWEMHTKGVGSKLLLKMGYQPGKGLGKNLQGINTPIEGHLRKGRGAIGAYGPEKKQQKMKIDATQIGDLETDKNEKSERTSLWRKEGLESNKKIHYVYKSVDEVLEESKKPGRKKTEISECSKVMVIDMTGPEQRILSGYHAIAGVQKPAEEWEIRKDKKFSNFSMPELQHNLNLLVDVSEQAIIENDRKLKYANDRLKVLGNQVEDLGRTMKQERKIIENLKIMIDSVESIVQASKEKCLTLKQAEEMFSSMKENHFTEFCAYEIPVLAVNIVRPLLKQSLENWQPLEEPSKPIPEFIKWRNILFIDDSTQTMNSYQLNPYNKLVWDAWVPCVRIATNTWECRQWSLMIDFIMNWIPLISNWILQNILQDMVLRRLQLQVDDWNPLTDRVPIHSWIHPWINFLGKNFETSVYPTIRHKLSKALTNWHPSDSSARLMLQPWVGVFDHGEMDGFLVNNIVPKLQNVLQDFIINPHQQCLDNWNWVMEWSEMIPAHTMASILDRFFFPKWLQTLSVWLNMNPDFNQVGKWFSGWKTIIPDNIKTQSLIVDHLRTALELMNKAIGGVGSGPLPERPLRNEEPIEVIRIMEPPVSLKSMVQSRCEERGILWIPISNRFMEAKQVYRCGKLQVYFDRNVLFVSQGGGSFTPMSWQEMLENAV
ncbi:hypothetical protein PGB90_001168 [Kerria lacca]